MVYGCGFTIRTQLDQRSNTFLAKTLIKNEGVYALNKGLTATMLNWIFHTTQQHYQMARIMKKLLWIPSTNLSTRQLRWF